MCCFLFFIELMKATVPSTNHSLEDMLADVVGKIGENISVGNVYLMKTTRGTIGSFVHDSVDSGFDDVTMGKYGSLVSVSGGENSVPEGKISTLKGRLAQHIVGMDPLSISVENAADGEEAAERALLSQKYLFSGTPVSDMLKEESSSMGCTELSVEMFALMSSSGARHDTSA